MDVSQAFFFSFCQFLCQFHSPCMGIMWRNIAFPPSAQTDFAVIPPPQQLQWHHKILLQSWQWLQKRICVPVAHTSLSLAGIHRRIPFQGQWHRENHSRQALAFCYKVASPAPAQTFFSLLDNYRTQVWHSRNPERRIIYNLQE